MTPEAAVWEFVAGILRLTLADLLRGGELDLAAYGDVEAAVRHQFEDAGTDFEALAQAVTATVPRNHRDAVGAAVDLLQQAYARQLRAKQQTAFLIGLEVGRATARHPVS
jgi:hypothetical protein